MRDCIMLDYTSGCANFIYYIENNTLIFLDQVKAYLRSHHVSKELRQRIDNWYQHLHINKKIIRENEILQQLPVYLRTEIAVSVHLPTLSKVTIFQNCDKSLLEELVLKLIPQVGKKCGSKS